MKKPKEEDKEIFLTKEEVLALPPHVKKAIVHRLPRGWKVIRGIALELLTKGRTPPAYELHTYAKNYWHSPYYPWSILRAHLIRYGIDVEYKRDAKEGIDFSYWELKGLKIKERELKALMNIAQQD